MSQLAEEERAEHEEEDEDANWNCFPGLAVQLGHGGVILVLFETPSGFAIFSYDGVKLLLPRAIEHVWTDFVMDDRAKTIVWLKKFQTFEDKASAINLDTGLNERLAMMIKKHIKHEQKLAGISCLYDGTVMELMWGLKNCMHCLVPGELTNNYRPLMSEGMKIVLDKYDQQPEMVNNDIIEVVCVVYNSDYRVDKHSESLHEAGKQLKKISDINCEDWDLLKLVIALKMICYPEEELLIGDPRKIFSDDEHIKLQQDAPLYEDKLWGRAILTVYNQILRARLIRNKWLRQLPHYLKEAKEAYEAAQAVSSTSP